MSVDDDQHVTETDGAEQENDIVLCRATNEPIDELMMLSRDKLKLAQTSWIGNSLILAAQLLAKDNSDHLVCCRF